MTYYVCHNSLSKLGIVTGFSESDSILESGISWSLYIMNHGIFKRWVNKDHWNQIKKSNQHSSVSPNHINEN